MAPLDFLSIGLADHPNAERFFAAVMERDVVPLKFELLTPEDEPVDGVAAQAREELARQAQRQGAQILDDTLVALVRVLGRQKHYGVFAAARLEKASRPAPVIVRE